MALRDWLQGKTAQEVATIAGYLLDGVEVAASITGNATVEDAAAALSGVDTVLTSLISGVNGTISADDVLAKIQPLQQAIADDNAAVDAEAAGKFPSK